MIRGKKKRSAVEVLMSNTVEKHSKKSHYSSEKQLRIADKQLQQAL